MHSWGQSVYQSPRCMSYVVYRSSRFDCSLGTVQLFRLMVMSEQAAIKTAGGAELLATEAALLLRRRQPVCRAGIVL